MYSSVLKIAYAADLNEQLVASSHLCQMNFTFLFFLYLFVSDDGARLHEHGILETTFWAHSVMCNLTATGSHFKLVHSSFSYKNLPLIRSFTSDPYFYFVNLGLWWDIWISFLLGNELGSFPKVIYSRDASLWRGTGSFRKKWYTERTRI